jgi:thiol-disulfide isomerase/thioredoxin
LLIAHCVLTTARPANKQDLVESSLLGGTLSIAASLFIAFLLVAEFRSYMRFDTESIMVVDRSPHGEMLRINFNISFPALSCEYATLDVSDALGSKKLNLTKTVRKAPIDAESLAKVGYGVEDFKRPEPKYDEFPDFGDADPYGEMDFLVPLDEASWDAHMNHYDVVIVNFFAPWCHWCQQLAPTWEAVTQVVHQKYPEADGRVRYVCVLVVLCFLWMSQSVPLAVSECRPPSVPRLPLFTQPFARSPVSGWPKSTAWPPRICARNIRSRPSHRSEFSSTVRTMWWTKLAGTTISRTMEIAPPRH